jgi:hypothetical protein
MILAEVRSRGVLLSAGPNGRLRWRCKGTLPKDLLQLLAEHKLALLALLPQAWDAVEADRLLAEARAALAQAEVEHRAGRVTAVRLNVVRLWLEVAEGYVHNHQFEAQRGWDVMPLLRATVRHAQEAARPVQPVDVPTAPATFGQFVSQLQAHAPAFRSK